MEYSNRYGWVSDDPVADEQMGIMYPKGADKADNDFKVRFIKAYRDVVMALMHVKDNPTIELSYIGIILVMNDFIDIIDEWDKVFEDDTIRKSIERLVNAIEGVGLWSLVDEPYAKDLSFYAIEAQRSLN